MPTARSTAEEYHRLTKYGQDSLRPGPGLDFSSQPEQSKDIVSSKRVSLRSFLPEGDGAQQALCRNGIGMACLGRLLFYTNGVTGVIRYQNGGSQLLRAAPSAGALYPTEIYVALRGMEGVEAGLYNYQVRTHELVCLWEGDQMQAIQSACGNHPAFDSASACVLLTGLHWRSAWRYQERGYRRVLLDTGHVAANLVAYAAHEGCTAVPIQGFCDGAINGLFFFDDTQEGALVALPLLEGPSVPDPAPLWTSPRLEAGAMQAVPLKQAADLRRSATIMLHRASSCGAIRPPPKAAGTPAAISPDSIPLDAKANISLDIPGAIVQRRSARGYAEEPISLGDLARLLAYSFGRRGTARYATREAGQLEAHLVVHDVAGLEAGLYRVEGSGEALKPVHRADLKPVFFRIALNQEIARTCAVILVLTAAASESIALWGDRAYRHLHLEAGRLGERFQLGAGALGMGACGIGGFLDDEAATAVGIRSDDFVLYMVTVGHV